MIKIENFEVVGWEHAIRGMRNPMNSWEKSDSFECVCDTPIFAECNGCIFNEDDERCLRGNDTFIIGPNDHELMMKLAKGGPVHAKYRRMITVYVDITAPLYWWKEFDTYKVGTVANSCSTMHKIHEKEFTMDDFSCEHLIDDERIDMKMCDPFTAKGFLHWHILNVLNGYRNKFLETKDKKYWWQMIQLLPSSYNQKRTVMLNYEVLAGLYPMRKNHKLDEWQIFCSWIKKLPYSEIITGISENSVHYSYEVNGHTGEVVVDGFASDDDIKLAIMDDLYNVEYEKMEGNEND